MTPSLPTGQITRMTMPPMIRRSEAPQKDQAAKSSQSVRTVQAMPAAGPSNPRAAFKPRVVNSPLEQDTIIEAGMVNLANNQPKVETHQGSKTDWGIIDALLPDIRRGFKQKDIERIEPKTDDESARLLIAQTLLRKDKLTREQQLASMTWTDQYSVLTQEALGKAVGELQHRDDAAVRYWELYCKNQGFEDGSNFTVWKTFQYVAEYIAPLIRYDVGQGQKSSAAEVFYSPLEILATQTTASLADNSSNSDSQHNSWISSSMSSSNDVPDTPVGTNSKGRSSVSGSSGHTGEPVRKWSSPTGTGEPTLSDTALDRLSLGDNPSASPAEVRMDVDTPKSLSTSKNAVSLAGNSALSDPINALLAMANVRHSSVNVGWNQETMLQASVETIKNTQEIVTNSQTPPAVSRLNFMEDRQLVDVLCPTQMIPPIPWFTGRRPVHDPPLHRLNLSLKSVGEVLWEYRIGFLLGVGIPRPRHIKVVPPRWPSIKDLCKKYEYQWVHLDDVALLKSRLAIVKMYLIYTEVDNLTVTEAIQKLESWRAGDDLLPFGNMLAERVKDRFLAGTADNLRYSELPYVPDEEPLKGSANDFYQGAPRPEEGPVWYSSYGAKGDFTARGPLRHPTMVYFPDLKITSIEKIWFEWHQKLTHLQGRDRSYWELPGSSERHYSEFCLRKQIVLAICKGLLMGSVAKEQYAFVELAAKQQSSNNRLVGFGDKLDFRTAVFVHKDATASDIQSQLQLAAMEAARKQREEEQADAKLTGPERKENQKNLRVKRLQYVKELIREDLKSRIATAKQEAVMEVEQQRQQMEKNREVARRRQQALETERNAVSDLRRKDKGVAKGMAKGAWVKAEPVDTRLVV